jgi:hypothetical protein
MKPIVTDYTSVDTAEFYPYGTKNLENAENMPLTFR